LGGFWVSARVGWRDHQSCHEWSTDAVNHHDQQIDRNLGIKILSLCGKSFKRQFLRPVILQGLRFNL
jgi:hypothetical protein